MGYSRIGLLILCAAVIPSCGGGSSDGAAPSSLNGNPSVSRDGRFVIFESASRAGRQVVITDRVNATSEVAAASEDLANAVVTPDGRFIAFDARPAGSATRQVFLRDLTTGVTTLVSAAPGDLPGGGDSTNPSISDDGRFVAFQSSAVDLGARSASSNTVLVREVSSGSIQSASSTDSSDDVNPAISGNGQFVSFESRPPSGFASVVLFNQRSGQVSPVSQTPGAPALDGSSGAPSLSFDGRLIAFESRATNVTPASPETTPFRGESNILVRDAVTGALFVGSVSLTPGAPANGDSRHPAISRDGQRVAFDSSATNLTGDAVPAGTSNIFVRDLNAQTTELVTRPAVPPTTGPSTGTPTGNGGGGATTTPPTPVQPTPGGLTTSTPVPPPTATGSGLSTSTPVQPTGIAGGLTTSTPVQPTATGGGLTTSTPVQPTGMAGGLSTSTPVQPTATGGGLTTSTPVQPTATGGGLSTSTPVQPTGTGGGLTTSTPVQPTGTGSGLTTSTPVQPTGTVGGVTTVGGVSAGSVRPRISSDGAWIVFESRGRVFLADLGTGDVSEIRGPVLPAPVSTGK